MSGKYALIIGNTEYTDSGLSQLTAPGKDAEDLARVLQDKEICAFDEVSVLINQPSFSAIEAIDEFFDKKKTDDLVVLYFSGHGIRDETGSLYLATKNTNRFRLRATAIKSDFIREVMDHSRSRRQVLILDCCNSGAFPLGTKGPTGISIGTATAFEGRGYGRVVLTASDSTQFAWEGDKVIGETDNSLFTHFIIEGLEGKADQNSDGNITVDELYDYIYNQVVSITPNQTPGKWSYKEQGEIVLRHYVPHGQKTTRTEELRRELYEREKQFHLKEQALRRESEKLKESITKPVPQPVNTIQVKESKSLTIWMLGFAIACLVLFLCVSTIGFQFLLPYIVVSTTMPENIDTSQTNPAGIFTVESESPTVTNTAIIPFSNEPEEFLKDIQYLSVETFDEQSSNSWGIWNGIIENGVMKIFADENWKGATYNKTFTEGEGIIIDLNYTEEHYFEIIFDFSVFKTNPYRRFGIYIGNNQVKLNKYEGFNDFGGENITGNLNLTPNKDYSMLLAISPQGEFLVGVWDPNDSSQAMYYKNMLGEEWAKLNWVLQLQVNQGTVSFDNFSVITFSGVK